MPFIAKSTRATCLIGLLLIWRVAAATAQAHPLSVYLQEGFNTTGIPSGWTVTPVSGTTATWSVVGTGTNPPVIPYAGTGQAKFNSYDATPGHQSRLTSRRVDLSAAADPFLTFFLYHDEEFFSSLDSIYLEATLGDSVTGPWTTLAGYQRPRITATWGQELVSLLQYNGSARMFISFRGVSQYGNNIYVDELRIADSSFHDIGMLSLLSPAGSLDTSSSAMNRSRIHDKPGKHTAEKPMEHELLSVVPFVTPLNLSAIVQNHGTFSEPIYQVRWQIDGQNQTAVNNTETLARNGQDTVTLSWLNPTPGTHVITAWTSLVSDSNTSNDSLQLTLAVLDSSVIFSEMFNGAVFPPAGWTAVNRDGGSLPPWFQGTSSSTFLPYEGTGFAANNFQRANGTHIDDYLISPPIAGINQIGRSDSLRFMVRSAFNPPPNVNYPDSVMVLLSTTGADTSNFTIFVDYFAAPKTGWTARGYPLSARVPLNSTVRVALRYLHFDGGSSGSNSDFVGVDFLHITRSLPTSVGNPPLAAPSFTLHQNYPNPFNPTTEILFSVAASGRATLDFYNTLGQRIGTLFNGEAEPGQVYRVRLDGSRLASGVYYYRLQSGAWTDSKRLVLLR